MTRNKALMLYNILARQWQIELSKWRSMPPFSPQWERQGAKVAQAYRESVEAYKLLDPTISTAWVTSEKR